MNEFDIKASGWDSNPMHRDRSVAIVNQLLERLPLNTGMTALEFGAGTGITSFLLRDHLSKITMIDSSEEMVRIMKKKVEASGATNLEPVLFDLEKNEWEGVKFDLLITQMVLHHVNDLNNIFNKFNRLLNNGGILAIADLCTEDGSFHGPGFTGHNGFNPDELSLILRQNGFDNISHRTCFTINKQISDKENRQFEVFLLTANKT